MENERKFPITFFKRLLLLLFLAVTAILFCYSCSAISAVSNYKIDLKSAIGNVFETDNQQTVLVINSLEEAYLNTSDAEIAGVYSLEQKDNVLFMSKGEGEKKSKQVFVSISANELLWQNKNTFLYRWEEE